MTKKKRYRLKLLEYCGDPNNDIPNRTVMSLTVLGFKSRASIYKHFSPRDLIEIVAEGMRLRRKKYSRDLAKIDTALLNKAIAGDTQAAKLVYQRFEGWSAN